MAFNYVVTAQKATSVNYALSSNFTSPEDTNLIVSRTNRLEIYNLTPDGLVSVIDTTIYGRIGWMQVYRPSNCKTDLLFIKTEKDHQYFVLSYEDGQLVTKSKQDCTENRVRANEVSTPKNTIDPDCRMIGLNIYEGYFQCIPIDPRTGTLQSPVNVRLDETRILDLVCLHGQTQPTICMLYEDERATRHIKTYIPNFKDKTMTPGTWSQSNVENGASLLIPVPAPLNGVIVVGRGMIVYHNGTEFKAVKIQPTVIETYSRLENDGKRYLLGDMSGQIWVVVLETNPIGNAVTGINIEMLGQNSCASSIACLNQGRVFLGSRLGDSKLIQLNTTRNPETGSYVETLQTFTNLGPIVDFCVMDLDRQGQGQIVTCSGAFKDGSLRIVRNGIGINQQAVAEIPGIKGIWSLRKSFTSAYDTYLVQSFIEETRILALEGEEMDEVEFPGFLESKTILCHTMNRDQWLHVTDSEIRLLCASSQTTNDSWTPPAGINITVAAANPTQIVAATSDCQLFYFQVTDDHKIQQTSSLQLPHEVACLNLTPFEPESDQMTDATQHHSLKYMRTSYCAVGLWTDLTVRVLELPSLTEAVCEQLGGDTMARSVLFTRFEQQAYLLVGLGDGNLISFRINMSNAFALVDRKKVSLGTQPIFLTTFWTENTGYAFAACDRPTVIYAHKGKLMYSNVNTKDMVNMMCPFHSESFPECLVLASEQDLTVGTIDGVQKLHIQTIPINEWPRRIVHNTASRVVAVCTVRDEHETNYLRIYDDQTFENLDGFELDPFECCLSITSCELQDDPKEYVIVGTAYALEDDPEPHQGRLLVFDIRGVGVDRKLHLTAEKSVRGAVYCVSPFNGRLVAGVNSKTHVFKWNEKETNEPELVSECGHHGHVLVLHLECDGDFIIVGDLMKSMILLKYSSIQGTLEEIARDLDSNWMTAVNVLGDEMYIGAEADYNLFTLRHNMDAVTDEERVRLDVQGAYHLGDFVNKFRRGSLVMQPTGTETFPTPLLYGTVSGSIGMIVTLKENDFKILERVQAALQQVVKSIGDLNHVNWREFQTKRKRLERLNFVDGDLIETFLELTNTSMQQVMTSINDEGNHPEQLTIDTVTQLIEDMAQLH